MIALGKVSAETKGPVPQPLVEDNDIDFETGIPL